MRTPTVQSVKSTPASKIAAYNAPSGPIRTAHNGMPINPVLPRPASKANSTCLFDLL